MARAIRSAAGTLPEESRLRDHALVPGFGVSANHGDRTIRIGEAGMFETLPVDLTSRADLLRSEGLNIAVMENGTEFAIFAFDDEVRSEASSAVSALLEIGVRKLVVLSGDREAAVARVARTLEIGDFEGALRPEDKLARTRNLSQRFKVAMVGDGVNDGPALASAYLGIAMGGLGSDVAMNSADAVLVKDRLTAVPELLRLGRKTNQTVLFNLIFATSVILGLTIATFVTRLPLPVAVIAHEGSTVLVILSGLRLLRGP
jgi:Cd2+/Zn2+-exporting ATPase